MQIATKQIKLIIGLGNPDPAYTHTYHNVGQLALDVIARTLCETPPTLATPSRKAFASALCGPFILIKLETFMNESGRAAKEALSYFKKKPAQLLVIHDDSDMTIGTFKLSSNQSAGGHRGIQSLIDVLKTQDFYRLKIGIRQPQEKVRKKAEEFVLKNISKKDEKILEKVFTEIAQALSIVL